MDSETPIDDGMIQVDPTHEWIYEDCASLHMTAIPDGFLALLGKGVLVPMYRFFAESDKAILCIAAKEEFLGFICASNGSGSLMRDFAIRNCFRIFLPIAKALLKPTNAKKLYELIRYPVGSPSVDLPGSEILNFCVSENARGLGVGRRLFGRVCDELRNQGVNEIRIVTGASQVSAQRFYSRAGATLVDRLEVHAGVESIVYVYSLTSEGV